MPLTTKTALLESRIHDLSLADFGRREIELAEVEMPGLMACRKEFDSKTLAGGRITGSLHATIQTAVFIETLQKLGAEVRWCSCNIFSTQNHAAAALVKNRACTLFAWKGETLEEYWWCTYQALTWPDHDGPTLIVDDGGDATLLIHEGVNAEIVYEKTGTLPDPLQADSEEMRCLLQLLRDTLQLDPTKWRRMVRSVFTVLIVHSYRAVCYFLYPFWIISVSDLFLLSF